MAVKQSYSRMLRQLAEDSIRQMDQDGEMSDDEREGFATSLVRQWITYDGRATLLFEDHQIYLELGTTPLGKPCINALPGPTGWMTRIKEEWKIPSADIPEILEQLNGGQGAEAVNSEGVSLRLWVDPRERSHGVELLHSPPPGVPVKRDHTGLAAKALEATLGANLVSDERDTLARSVVRQWERYEGHASLFTDRDRLVFTLTNSDDGGGQVSARRCAANLIEVIRSLGIPPHIFSDVILRMNTVQAIEFWDRNGIRTRLRYNPKADEFRVERFETPWPVPAGAAGPIVCPACDAVLNSWQEHDRSQLCPRCGREVGRSEGL